MPHSIFSEECTQAFDKLKRELTHDPIMIKPDWSLPFEFMCDASDYAVGAVLGQSIDNVPTESYEGALPEMRQPKFFGNVIADHLENIMVSPLLQEKSLKPVSTGHISFATHAGWSKFVTHAIEKLAKHTSRDESPKKYILFCNNILNVGE
ncbi:reverse transcriptase domain-containing protein [Tanacetum coccineum]